MCEVEKGVTTAKEVYGYVDSIRLEWDTVPSDVDDNVPEEAVMMSMEGRPSCVRPLFIMMASQQVRLCRKPFWITSKLRCPLLKKTRAERRRLTSIVRIFSPLTSCSLFLSFSLSLSLSERRSTRRRRPLPKSTLLAMSWGIRNLRFLWNLSTGATLRFSFQRPMSVTLRRSRRNMHVKTTSAFLIQVDQRWQSVKEVVVQKRCTHAIKMLALKCRRVAKVLQKSSVIRFVEAESRRRRRQQPTCTSATKANAKRCRRVAKV